MTSGLLGRSDPNTTTHMRTHSDSYLPHGNIAFPLPTQQNVVFGLRCFHLHSHPPKQLFPFLRFQKKMETPKWKQPFPRHFGTGNRKKNCFQLETGLETPVSILQFPFFFWKQQNGNSDWEPQERLWKQNSPKGNLNRCRCLAE